MSAPQPQRLTRLLAELEAGGIRLGLETMRRLLGGLGDPQLRLPHVLVAGTNGKGSTAAFLHAIFVAAGYRSGLYSSPHLESVRERLRLDGLAVEADVLLARLERVVERAEEVAGDLPTYFEALTGVAFDLFADETQIAVLEVGLGGRLDATNCGEPVASLICEIGIDHSELLGATETAIALEKAGVMRRGMPALVSVGAASVRELLQERASAVGARWSDVRKETAIRRRADGRVDLTTPTGRYRLSVAAEGAHQVRNAALAVRTAEVLAGRGWPRLSAEAIVRGVEGCRWPGRCERVILPSGQRVLLDAAHNPQGARSLRRALAAAGEGRYTLLFGALADKDAAAVLAQLEGGASRIVLTRPPSERATRPEELRSLVADRPALVVEDPTAALDESLAGSTELVVVCGSIYLVGDVRAHLGRRFGTPPPAVEIDVASGSRAPQSG